MSNRVTENKEIGYKNDRYVVLVDNNGDVLDSYNVSDQAGNFNIDRCISVVCYKEYSKLESQLSTVTKQLEEAVKVVEFYSNRFSWRFSRHPEYESYAGEIINDDSLLKYIEADGDEFQDHCGGKRAREFLAKLNNSAYKHE